MMVETTRFGEIEVHDNQVITLADGLLGFSNCTRYILFSDEMGEPFNWMQSLDLPSLALVVVDPALILPKYQFSLQRDRVKGWTPKSDTDLQCFLITTLAANILEVTANLKGPIVVNKRNGLGAQIVLNDPVYSTRHPLFRDELDDEADAVEAVRRENMVASMRLTPASGIPALGNAG